MNRIALLGMLSCLLVLPAQAVSADPAAGTPSANAQAAGGKKRALVVCGLSGDAPHRKLFAETVDKLHAGLTQQLGFAAGDVQVLWGDEPDDGASAVIQAARRATREELETTAAAIRQQLQPADALWVVVLGHSHYDGRHSWLNLPGPDMHQLDFAKLFQGLAAAEQVFAITTPTSGFYIKPLSAKGRVVLTATEADWETNETEFPHELARVLSAPPPQQELDIDQDGAVTLFDVYVTVARNLAQSYVERELLATEHPLLDDNGDGRGAEVQIDFLTEEQGGRAKAKQPSLPPAKPTGDGAAARAIQLSFSRPE